MSTRHIYRYVVGFLPDEKTSHHVENTPLSTGPQRRYSAHTPREDPKHDHGVNPKHDPGMVHTGQHMKTNVKPTHLIEYILKPI
jgi:hypothetical protein